MMTYALVDSKQRTMIVDERSGIGYSYPRVLKEDVGDDWHARKYLNICATLGQAYPMDESDFDERFSKATPMYIADAAEYFGMNPEGLAQLANECILKAVA